MATGVMASGLIEAESVTYFGAVKRGRTAGSRAPRGRRHPARAVYQIEVRGREKSPATRDAPARSASPPFLSHDPRFYQQ